MGSVSITLFSSDTETVTRAKLNALVTPLRDEINGNLQNANIAADAAIAYSKLNLSSSLVKGDLGSSVAMSYTASFTDATLSSGVLTITHSLGRQYVNVTIWDNNDIEIGPDTITATDTNTLTIDLSSYGTLAGTWNYRVNA